MQFNLQQEQGRSFWERIYQGFLDWVVYPNFWVAAGIASLSWFAEAMMGLPYDWRPAALILATALIPYNLDRIFDSFVQKIPDERAQSYFRGNWGVWVLLIGTIASTILLLYLAPPAVRYVSIAIVVPVIYGSPIFPIPREGKLRWYRLKDIPGSKAWIVCGTITYAIVALPLAYAETGFNLQAALTAFFLLTFVGTNSHTFDIRDVESDREKGVMTLPLMLGVRGAKIFLTGWNVLMLAVMTWGWLSNHLAFFPEVLVATALNFVYLGSVTPKTPRNIYNIFIDGLLFVPAALHGMFVELGATL